MLGLHEIRGSTTFHWEKVLSDREKVDAFFSLLLLLWLPPLSLLCLSLIREMKFHTMSRPKF